MKKSRADSVPHTQEIRGAAVNPHTKLEHEIMLAISQKPYVRVWAVETGAAKTENGDWISYGLPGAADLTGIVWCKKLNVGIRIEIEVKTGAGKLSERQKKFKAMIERLGGFYLEARDILSAVTFVERIHNGTAEYFNFMVKK